MTGLIRRFLNILREKARGVSTVEYAVMLALIALAAILTIAYLGARTQDAYTSVNAELPGPPSADEERKKRCKDSSDDPDCGIGND